jgi:hypothetical protein
MRLLRSRFQANDAFIQAVAIYDSTLVTGAVRQIVQAADGALGIIPEEGVSDEANNIPSLPALLPAVTKTAAIPIPA